MLAQRFSYFYTPEIVFSVCRKKERALRNGKIAKSKKGQKSKKNGK